MALTEKRARFPGFRQRKVNFKVGEVVESGALPLPCDLVMHESVPMTLTDDTTLYSDIFVPPHVQALEIPCPSDQRIPAIIAWSPYGKQKGTTLLDDFPMRAGVPKIWLSGLQKWEGPDPAFWCARGYAIINVDTRGAYTSEGDLMMFGHQEAEDGAEFVTWVSKQPWCNGKVGMSGNSWLAIAQWRIGGLRPKGLSALAPWEGFHDYYRNHMYAGGILFPGFHQDIAATLASQGRLEDIVEYATKHDTMDDYCKDKLSHPEQINVPTYVVASYTNPVHTQGTFEAWNKLPDNIPKWLRVHNAMEWPDYHDDNSQRDLLRFFDYYLKDKTDNGWLTTPTVRLSVLNFGLSEKVDVVNRPENEFPLARTKYVRYYLCQNKTLSLQPPTDDSTVQYESNSDSVQFEYQMPGSCETTGYFMAHLYVSCAEHDEMDIFVHVENLSPARYRQGVMTIRPQSAVARRVLKFMHDWNITPPGGAGMSLHWGPNGQMRASHALSKGTPQSISNLPAYSFDKKSPMKSGEVRLVNIPIRPYGLFWERNDILRFTIKGSMVVPFPIPGLRMYETNNKGLSFVHCGGHGLDSSYLSVPHV